MLWQLFVLKRNISVAARDDTAEPRDVKQTSMDNGLCAASCKCCEACGCHPVACDNKETQKEVLKPAEWPAGGDPSKQIRSRLATHLLIVLQQ